MLSSSRVSLNRLSTPLITPILNQRLLSMVLIGFCLAQTTLVFFGLPAWPCPIRTATGIPCPGCGLTTATSLLLKGKWQESLQAHAFAPFVVLGFILLIVTTFLPAPYRARALYWLERFEKQTAFAVILLIALYVYWVWRLFYLLWFSVTLVTQI